MADVKEPGRPFTTAEAVRFRRFGRLGPVYEIEAVRDRVARIRVIESGETLDYPLDSLAQDPVA